MQAWRSRGAPTLGVLFGLLLRVGIVSGFFWLSCNGWAAATEKQVGGAFVNVGTANAPLRLWVEEEGHGTPILLIHGAGGSTYSWREMVPMLARSHRVISVDLKGFGRSDKPYDDAYGLLDQARLLKILVNRKALHDLTLIGHSLGGGVALALTLDLNRTQPGTVSRLVLIDSIAYRQSFPLFVQLLQTPLLGEVGLYGSLPELVTYKSLLAAYQDPNKISFATVRAYARPLYERGGRHALLKTAREIIPPNLSALTARYSTIVQPTLLIWCAEDSMVPLWVGRRLARVLPRAQLSVLKGCGHVPQEELPATTRSLIRAFMSD
jgi:pimeloyl-ACP methyl ester carboxylesterase